MIILLQSITFTDFDTVAVYENFWVLFYLISIYSIQKNGGMRLHFYLFLLFFKSIYCNIFLDEYILHLSFRYT